MFLSVRKDMGDIDKCPKSPDGKHNWTPINKFVDKCTFCGQTPQVFS